MLTPRNLADATEFGTPVQADPVDKTYEGDNRPTYIKERTNITPEQYNQFLSEFDDAVAQANLDYRQAILQQRIQQEATGTVYDPQERVLQNQALQNQLFQSAVSGIVDKYGVPTTYTTKGGERWELNKNGKYTRVTEVGGFDDYLKAAVKAGIMAVATAGLGSALAAGLGAAGVPTATANIIADVVVGVAQSGGDIKQGIINAFAPVPDELRQVTDYLPNGIDGLVDIARTVYDTANADIQPDISTDFEITLDPNQQDPITVDQDTNTVTVGLPTSEVTQPETATDTTQTGGGGQEVVTEGDLTGDPDVIFSDTVGQPTTPAEEGTFDPEHPWIYQGDGVFVHSRTGETVTQDVGDAPYVVGETYGGPTDQPQGPVDSGSEEPFQIPSIFGDVGLDGEDGEELLQGLEDGLGDSTGDSTGDGKGNGEGSGNNNGVNSGDGMFSLGGGASPITPKPFMASISYSPELLTPYMPMQSKDYLAELIARLQR